MPVTFGSPRPIRVRTQDDDDEHATSKTAGEVVSRFRHNSVAGLQRRKRERAAEINLVRAGSFSRNVHTVPHLPIETGDVLIAPSGAERVEQQVAVAIIETHYCRHCRVMPDQLFVDEQRLERAEWGYLRVDTRKPASAASPLAASYLRLHKSTPPGRVARLLAKYWKLPRPSVVLSVTGGAKEFKLSAELEAAVRRALVMVTATTSALVVTGGTNSGVMSLVGRLMATADTTGHGPPAILGVVPWRKLGGKQQLVQNDGEEQPREYRVEEGEGAGLEPHHTHFLMVDGGEGSGWGSEIDMRTAVEQMYEKLYSVPCVYMVVQGGLFTLATVRSSLSRRCRVVLIDGSGGAASVLCRYLAGWEAARGSSTLDLAAYEGGKWLSEAAVLQEVCKLNDAEQLLVPFDGQSGSDAAGEHASPQPLAAAHEAGERAGAGGCYVACLVVVALAVHAAW